MEFVDVEQVDGIARDVGQARAAGQGVVLGDLGIGEGIAPEDAPVGRQVAGHVDFEAAAAHLAGGDVEIRIDGVQGQDVFLDRVEDRRVDAEAAVQRRPLHAHLVGLAFLGVETAAQARRAGVGLERLGGAGVEGQFRGEVIADAQARGNGVVGIGPALTTGDEVVVVVLEALQAHATQHLEALGEGDLVLHEGGPGLEGLVVVGGRTGQGRARLAEDRIDQVDRIDPGAAGGALDDRLIVVVFNLDPGDQGMAEAKGVEATGQVQLQVAIAPFQLAVVEVATQGHAVGLHAIGFHGIALEAAVEVLEAAGQGPGVVQLVLEAQLIGLAVVVQQVGGALFPGIGGATGFGALGQVVGAAAVQRGVAADDVRLEGDKGGVGGLPAQHRGHFVALVLDIVAEAVAAFGDQVEAIGQAAVFIHRAGGVQGAAPQALVGELAAEGGLALAQRLLGDHVEGAARIAAAIEGRRRAAQDLDPLQGGGIRRAGIAAIHGEAVAEIFGAGEAAHRVAGQALTAEVVATADAAGLVQRLLQAGGGEVVEGLAGDHAHRLGRLVQRGVGAGRTAGTLCLVALYRTGGRFGRADDGEIGQRLGRVFRLLLGMTGEGEGTEGQQIESRDQPAHCYRPGVGEADSRAGYKVDTTASRYRLRHIFIGLVGSLATSGPGVRAEAPADVYRTRRGRRGRRFCRSMPLLCRRDRP